MVAEVEQIAPSAAGEMGVERNKIIKIDLCGVNGAKARRTTTHLSLWFAAQTPSCAAKFFRPTQLPGKSAKIRWRADNTKRGGPQQDC
jgi:hypothetical protein